MFNRIAQAVFTVIIAYLVLTVLETITHHTAHLVKKIVCKFKPNQSTV